MTNLTNKPISLWHRLAAVLTGWLLLAACAQAQSAALLQQVLAQLGQHSEVRADFTQSRDNPALAQPQVSQGQLLFVSGRGMLWQIQSPLTETLALTGSRAARIDAKGHATSTGNDRGFARVSQMLQSLLAGKPEEAMRQFDVSAEGDLQRWQLGFTPRQSRVAQVLARIELTGGEFIEGIRIELRNGESTQIRFEQARDAGELSAFERRALGLSP